MNKLKDLFTPEARKWIYNIVAAAIPLLVILDILTPEVASQGLLIAAAVLGLGSNLLASANVSKPDATVTTDEFKG